MLNIFAKSLFTTAFCVLAFTVTLACRAADTVEVSTTVSIGSASQNTNYLNKNIHITSAGSLTYLAYMPNATSAITITNDGTLIFTGWSGSMYSIVTNSAGTVTLNGSKGFTVQTSGQTTQATNGNYTLNVAYDSGALIDIKSGTFRNGSYQGQNWTANKADLNIASGATLDLWDGASIYVNALTGAGTITATQTSGGSPQTFIFGVDNGSGTFTGTITGNASTPTKNVISIEKRGTGTQILTGANTYTGSTTVTAGTLQIGNNTPGATLGASDGKVSVAADATLVFNRSDAYFVGNAVTNSGSIVLQTGYTDLKNLTNSGTVTVKSGAMAPVRNRTELETPIYTFEDGSVKMLRASSTDTTAWTFDEIATLRATNNYGAYSESTGTEAVDALLTGSSPLNLVTSGTFEITKANSTFTGGLNIASGTVRMTSTGSLSSSCPIDVLKTGTFILDLGTGTTSTLSYKITGAGLMRLASGTLNVTSSSPKSTTSGYTMIDQVTVADGASLVYQNVDPRPVAGQTITLTAESGGVIRFESNSTGINHTGKVLTSAGKIVLKGAGTFEFAKGSTSMISTENGYGEIALSEGGWMDVKESGNLIVGGWSSHITRTNNYGSLNVASGSIVSLWDGNELQIDSLTGAGTVQSGALRIGVANNVNSEKYGVTNNTATFTGILKDELVNGGNKVTSLVKVGTGTQILTGNSTYTGKTTISAGTLQVGNGGTTGSLGTGEISITANATLVYNKTGETTLTHTISGAGTIENKSGTLNLGSASTPQTLTEKLCLKADSGATLNAYVSNGQNLFGTYSGSGTISFNGSGASATALNALTGTFKMDSAGTTVLNGVTLTALPSSQFGTLSVTEDSTLNLTNLTGTWFKTVYTDTALAGNITPTSAYSKSTYLREGRDVTDVMNCTVNATVRANGLPNNSAFSYLTTIHVANDITLDLTGSYDDYAGIFFHPLNEDGTLQGDWITALAYGGKCNRVSSTYTLKAGDYLMDARVADATGDACANNAGILDASTGDRMGLGMRIKSGSLTGTNYYSLAIDENGVVGDASLGITTVTPTEVSLVQKSFNVADGKTLTIQPAATTSKLTMGEITGTGEGTLEIANVSGQNMDLVLSGSTTGNLALGENISLTLSTSNKIEVAGTYSQGKNTEVTIDLTGVTEETGIWFEQATAGTFGDGAKITLTTSDTVLNPTEVKLFGSSNLTSEQWTKVLDFSQLAGKMNVVDLSVGPNGVTFTVGDLNALPEPSAWLLLLLGTTFFFRRGVWFKR